MAVAHAVLAEPAVLGPHGLFFGVFGRDGDRAAVVGPAGDHVDAVTAACLRGLSDALVRNQLATAFAANISNPVPSVDGKVLPATIKDTFAAGRNNKVPVINGSNQDEFALFFAMTELAARTRASATCRALPANSKM